LQFHEHSNKKVKFTVEQAVDGVGGECHTPTTLPLGKRPSTNRTGGWLGPRASLDRCRKSHPPLGFSPKTMNRVVSCYADYTERLC
jgi:hypothetical protein